MTTSSPHTHFARAPYKEPPAHAPNAALMIDFDNVTMGIRSDLQTELKRLMQSEIIRGKVAVQRAYADWRRYPQYMVPLAEASIDTIQATAYGSSKKNATDIRLAVDAVELVFTRPEIGTYILLSGDSDFSSLVLKLKEYGKYVIGVGIRESSSDLLVMNCDEYYSYNELAGLTRANDVEHVRHDPWELVVEAVKQMTAHNDVMRSDRLKQVMQEIDPGFDEKDVGYSRFSKFVQEAAHRGLIATQRLDNGQFEISLGARVDDAPPPAQPAAPPATAPVPPTPPTPPAPRARKGSIVGDAFGLLRQALGKLSGDQAVSADAVREAMNDLAPEGTKRVDARSMPKLLRQAHDAELIDLSKDDAGAYAVRVRQEEPAAEVPIPPPVARPEPAEEEYEPPQPASSAPPPPYSQGTQPGGMPTRSARFRRGSRGPRPGAPDVPRVGVVEVDPNFRSRVERIPPRSGPPAPAGGETPSVGSGGRSDDDRPRRERGGRGRGGRGRGRGGNREGREGNGGHGGHGGHGSPGGHGGHGAQGGHAGYEGRESREGRGGGEGESSRGRRGGRGRGGRGGGRSDRNGEDRSRAVASYDSPRAPEPSAPPPPPVKAPAPPEREEGDSFWSRVKRGLIGGE
ncbi:MAG TPA: NYN domain-containing protein [Gemmatimonadales bacterium]|nr:NYN domain-containing protein [Gemmatimonadales bacterium]